MYWYVKARRDEFQPSYRNSATLAEVSHGLSHNNVLYLADNAVARCLVALRYCVRTAEAIILSYGLQVSP